MWSIDVCFKCALCKLMKPSRLDLDPSSTSASKEWKHWRRTFENYIGERDHQRQSGRQVEVASKLRVSYRLRFHWAMRNYDEAVTAFQNLFVHVPNKTFARHLLATTKQQQGQTLDKFLQTLRKLSKDCNFRAVTAEQYKQEMIRDAFINGLLSHAIRQRLLENRELELATAFEQARTLDLAQKNSEAYDLRKVLASSTSGDASSLGIGWKFAKTLFLLQIFIPQPKGMSREGRSLSCVWEKGSFRKGV